MNHVILATDSRGAGLPDFAKKQVYPVHTIIIPGGSIGDVANAAKKKAQEIQGQELLQIQFLIIIAAGICNLTSKEKHQNGIEISYNYNSDRKQKLINEIQSIYKSMNTDSFNTKIVHIPAVSLNKYQDFNIQKKNYPVVYTHQIKRMTNKLNLNQTLKKSTVKSPNKT